MNNLLFKFLVFFTSIKIDFRHTFRLIRASLATNGINDTKVNHFVLLKNKREVQPHLDNEAYFEEVDKYMKLLTLPFQKKENNVGFKICNIPTYISGLLYRAVNLLDIQANDIEPYQIDENNFTSEEYKYFLDLSKKKHISLMGEGRGLFIFVFYEEGFNQYKLKQVYITYQGNWIPLAIYDIKSLPEYFVYNDSGEYLVISVADYGIDFPIEAEDGRVFEGVVGERNKLFLDVIEKHLKEQNLLPENYMPNSLQFGFNANLQRKVLSYTERLTTTVTKTHLLPDINVFEIVNARNWQLRNKNAKA